MSHKHPDGRTWSLGCTQCGEQEGRLRTVSPETWCRTHVTQGPEAGTHSGNTPGYGPLQPPRLFLGRVGTLRTEAQDPEGRFPPYPEVALELVRE